MSEVEMIPFGASELEHASAEYKDVVKEFGTVRCLQIPAQVNVVSWKHEGAEGPIFIDGLPLAEIMFTDDPALAGSWSRCWFPRRQARQLAKDLHARFEEV